MSNERDRLPTLKTVCLSPPETRGRVAVFIDGASLFYAALQLGIELDYSRLLAALVGEARLLRAFFYTGVDNNNEKQQGFLMWMRRNGYRVVAKPLLQMPDGSKKTNLDVEMAVDMLTLTDHYDTAIVVSGSGNLARAVDAVSYQGARIEIVSLRAMTSDGLINVADSYLDLETLQADVQKQNLEKQSSSKIGGQPTRSSSHYVRRPLTAAS
ncbi:MAG: NYN domain-containing protein [Cyanobacteria bacterium J06626_23]